MATRYLDEVSFRAAPELVGAPLASPMRRILAFGLDIAIVAVPTLAVTLTSAILWVRLTDRPAFEALGAFNDGHASAEARRRAAKDFAPLLARIRAPGLPAAVSCAVEEGRLDDAAEIISTHDLLLVLRLGQHKEEPQPGTIVVPIEELIPGGVRGLVLFGAQAAYFTILTSLWGATLGKRIVGIRVRRLDGERLSLPEAFERFTGYLHVPALVGWPLLDLWRDLNRQLPHDRTARTVVLRAVRGASGPADAPVSPAEAPAEQGPEAVRAASREQPEADSP